MNIKLLKTFLFLFCCCFCFSQQGTLTGVLVADSTPLPGATIIIKGTATGAQTDFDGKYSIKCSVGDVLQISYVGMKTREFVVTASMFKDVIEDTISVPYEKVNLITSNAYSKAIQRDTSFNFSPSMANAKHHYNYRNIDNRIKDITIKKDSIVITPLKPEVYFEVGFTTHTSHFFFNKKHLPKLQNTFAQGASLNGNLTFLGPETGNVFSYGSALHTLEFNGSNYTYDTNGQLVPIGNGNGTFANSYDNTVLANSYKTLNNAYVNVSTDESHWKLGINQLRFSDVFNKEKSVSNDATLSFKNNVLDGFINYGYTTDNQPNTNGFINTMLLNTWGTPPSFSNRQGLVLSNNSQRRFNPNFNNPLWLTQNSINNRKTNFLITKLETDFRLSDDIWFNGIMSYTKDDKIENFGLPTSNIAFEDGYLSRKSIKNNTLNVVTSAKTNFDRDFTLFNKIALHTENLDYTFKESLGFTPFTFTNPTTIYTANQDINRTVLRLHNKLTYDDYDIDITIGNNAHISSIQNNKWLLPFLNASIDIGDIFDWYNSVYINVTAAYDVNDTPLFYNNKSHNSLNITPEESLTYTANNDLFVDNSLKLEEKRDVNIALGGSDYFNDHYVSLKASYYNSLTKNSVFPVLQNNTFQLENVADVKKEGLEFELNSHFDVFNDYDKELRTTVVFSTYKTKVLSLYTNADRIPIAGFSSVSKNLIVGEQAGVIIGSAYERDSNNNIVIDNNGFPIVATTPKIIGDPTPKFNLGITNTIKLDKFSFSFTIDIQKGGDVWNGTQNTLNYLGTSQQSAEERLITNYVFNGVNTSGQPNTMPVDFYNPQNSITDSRFVRYGFPGVAEDAIVDGSYINFKAISLNYNVDFNRNSSTPFIRTLDISLYAENLLTWTKYSGASPYTNLFDSTSAQGLNFFNLPLATEIGLKLNFKI